MSTSLVPSLDLTVDGDVHAQLLEASEEVELPVHAMHVDAFPAPENTV